MGADGDGVLENPPPPPIKWSKNQCIIRGKNLTSSAGGHALSCQHLQVGLFDRNVLAVTSRDTEKESTLCIL